MATLTSERMMSVATDALDVKEIQSIETSTGWVNIKSCELVQFAVGEAHSPISPSKLYPTLRYTDSNGRSVYTPLSKVLAFSRDPSR